MTKLAIALEADDELRTNVARSCPPWIGSCQIRYYRRQKIRLYTNQIAKGFVKLHEFKFFPNNRSVATRITTPIYHLSTHDHQLPTGAMPFRLAVAST